jgi:hypothetical protein
MYDFKDHQKEEQKRAEKNRDEYLALKESGDLPEGIGSFEQFLEHKELEKAKEQANAEEDKVRELEKEKAKLKTKEITEKITTDEFDDRLAKTVEKSLDTSSLEQKLDKLYDVMNHIRWMMLGFILVTIIVPLILANL